MKSLLLGQYGIGDHLSNILPMARALSRRGDIVHGVLHNLHGYRLMRETPFFDSLTRLPHCDYEDQASMIGVLGELAGTFPHYDRVYATSDALREFVRETVDARWLANLVDPNPSIDVNQYRPVYQLSRFGVAYEDGWDRVAIDWYREFHRDFQCGPTSILLNLRSSRRERSYGRAAEVRALLESRGFDVREPDAQVDIRTNMHLVHQCRSVLTTDTATFWMARSLGRPVSVVLGGSCCSPGEEERRLGSLNLVSHAFCGMDAIPPMAIVERFLAAWPADDRPDSLA
jgi:hypothetical protein